MNKHLRIFLNLNLVVLIMLLIIGSVVFLFFISDLFHPSYLLVLFLSFGINYLAYYLFSRKPQRGNKIIAQVTQLFAIKFFYYLIIGIIFLLILPLKEEKISFVIVLFIIYIAFTAIEVRALSRFVKSEQNNS